MSNEQHTKGPWDFDGEGLIASESDPSGRTICRAHYKDAHRIVACVNACEGMDDPAAEIARLRKRLSLLDTVAQALTAERDEALDALEALHIGGDNKCYKGVHEDEWSNRAASILRKHGRLT